MNPSIVVFDFGGVLVDWDPRRVYQHLLPDMAAIEQFLATVCTPEWNVKQDAGRSIAAAEAELIARFPDKAHLIRAYYAGHEVAVGGAVQGTVDILERLHARNVPLYGLTNWSGETFPRSRWRFAAPRDARDRRRDRARQTADPLGAARVVPALARGDRRAGVHVCAERASRLGRASAAAGTARVGARRRRSRGGAALGGAALGGARGR